jgi:signal transduction histidine kinase
MQVFEYELPLLQDVRDFETQVVPSGPDEVLMMIRDITERKAHLAVLEKERARIIRNLHDGLGQHLGYLHLKLDELINNETLPETMELRQTLVQMRSVVNEAYEQVRRLLAASRLRNSTDLATALLLQARSIGQQANFEVHLTSHGSARPLSPIVQQQVLYLFQEALTNVARHAKAQQVWIELHWSDTALTVEFSDDGQGFDPENGQPEGRFGLMLMRQRAKELNGRLTLASNSAAGTDLTLWLPLELAV